ncbi:MAG TPA: hypothetical protein DIV86_05035, partial [Alphaproteobacteria bacterium]|nr:hypothetical protein [Alphaproteobacteria bacterium]
LTYGQEYLNELAKCKIGLNLPQFTEDEFQPHLYSSDRISQYFGNGLLTFLHKKTGYQEIFQEDVEAVFYSEFDDLMQKIQHYAFDNSARIKIAKNGWTKYYILCNSKKITQDVVNLVTSGEN